MSYHRHAYRLRYDDAVFTYCDVCQCVPTRLVAKDPDVAKDKVGKTMKEFKAGKLRSSSGDKVTKRDQAIAIGLSEQRSKEAQARTERKLKGKPV